MGERDAFEAWATEYFGKDVGYPEACFHAWKASRIKAVEECAKAVEYTLQDGLLTVDVHARRIRELISL